MLSVRSDPLCAEERAIGLVHVHMHKPEIAQHHTATSLVFEACLTDHEGVGLEVGVPGTDERDSWLRKQDCDLRAANQWHYVGEAGSVGACCTAFVAGFVLH